MTQVSAGVRQRVVHPSDPKGVPHVPGPHALPTGPPLSAIERPRQTRTMPARTAPGPAGYELRAFECPKCDRVHRTLVVSDPMSGDARGWLRGELKSPD